MRALAVMRLASRAALLAGFAVVAAAAAPSAPRASTPLPSDSVYQLEARLVDQEGRAIEFRALRGTPRLVTFVYTSCQYVCPLIIDSVKGIERDLTSATRQRIGFVLISLDPTRDSPPVLKRLMGERRLDPAHWLLLQPSAADLRALAGVLGMRYRALADGEFNHTTTLVLIDEEGRVVARSGHIGGKAEPEFLAAIERAGATPGQ